MIDYSNHLSQHPHLMLLYLKKFQNLLDGELQPAQLNIDFPKIDDEMIVTISKGENQLWIRNYHLVKLFEGLVKINLETVSKMKLAIYYFESENKNRIQIDFTYYNKPYPEEYRKTIGKRKTRLDE